MFYSYSMSVYTMSQCKKEKKEKKEKKLCKKKFLMYFKMIQSSYCTVNHKLKFI